MEMPFAPQVASELQAEACKLGPGVAKAGRLVLEVIEVDMLVLRVGQEQLVDRLAPNEAPRVLAALDQASKLGSKRGHQGQASEAPWANPFPSSTKPEEYLNYQVVRSELY